MKISFSAAAACTAILTLIVAGCISPAPGGAAPPVATMTTPALSTCGFTSCHRLDLACGSRSPEVCTALYQLGDKCRQYAYCSTSGGTCTLVRTPAFDACRSCIEQCGGADATEIFTCEEKC
jgi:hypothetical protein